MSMTFDWKSIVSSVAPMLGTALGGPLGGMAGKALAGALGCDLAEASLSKTVLAATNEQLILIQKAEQEFRLAMEKLGFENQQALERLAADDRNSARSREISTRDSWTPRVLAASVIVAWGGVQFFLLRHVVDAAMREMIVRMLGTLDAAVLLVLSYYFGSSAGSSRKTDLLREKP